MKVLKPPSPVDPAGSLSVFLAGSIEMGKAVDWQAYVTEKLSDLPGTLYNPRRDDWDPTWEQSIEHPQFRAQVEWELDALDRSTVIAMYFEPGTKSPITLLELGLYAGHGTLIVCCPDGFWRKGNVDVVCQRFQHRISVASSLEDLIDQTRDRIISAERRLINRTRMVRVLGGNDE